VKCLRSLNLKPFVDVEFYSVNIHNRYLLIFLFPVLMMTGNPVCAQTSSYGELQAAYLYNFAKYITWPKASEQFVIGVFQEADIMDALVTTLKGKKVGGKPIVLKKITKEEELRDCHILYLSESNSGSIGLIVTVLNGNNTLIVTEADLIRKGAVISFVVEDDRLKFKLKKKVLNEAGLVASEGLLRLAILQ
jgi:hypothetical protein